MTTGTIFKIKKYALHDGPGIRTTVFFKGCPLRCPWCHNPEGIDADPQPMRRRTSSGETVETVGRTLGVADLIREIEKDTLFYDESGGGVTFSGGEPLAQPDFLDGLLAACDRREIHTALDTSGYAPAAVVERLLPRLNLVLFDIKLVDADRHLQVTGVANRIILDNLARVDASGTPLRIRVPLVPGMTDDAANIDAIVHVAEGLQSLAGVDLLPFHRIGGEKYRRLGAKDALSTIAPLSKGRLTDIQTRFERAGLRVTLGG